MSASLAGHLSDIQGGVLYAYRAPGASPSHPMQHARWLFFRITDGPSARCWIHFLITDHDCVTTAADQDDLLANDPSVAQAGSAARDGWVAINLALSAAAFEALGTREDWRNQLPGAFVAGMHGRAGILGDSGEGWEEPFGPAGPHIAIGLQSDSLEAIEKTTGWIQMVAEGHGLTTLPMQDCARRTLDPDRLWWSLVDHFGLADGFGQPHIEGVEHKRRQGKRLPESQGGGWGPLRAGEFILGYEDEGGDVPPIRRTSDISDESWRRFHRFMTNGVFMVYRKLEMHVGTYATFIEKEAGRLRMDREELAARLVGRWPDGTPVLSGDAPPDPATWDQRQKDNAWSRFDYSQDAGGAACPLGAHIRRANPRDALGGLLTKRVNRHRIIRRGIPYGDFLDGDLAEAPNEGRGLIFISFQADIRRQFEVIQGEWLKSGSIFGLQGQPDPFVREGQLRHVIQGGTDVEGIPAVCTATDQFVTLKGGEYFLLPSMSALRALAAGVDLPPSAS